jgi:hypothetical protein
MSLEENLKSAVALALAGEWDPAHRIVQEFNDPTACWIHAVLHKIEGDSWNSRYWYGRTHHHDYEDYPDARVELFAIAEHLNQTH